MKSKKNTTRKPPFNPGDRVLAKYPFPTGEVIKIVGTCRWSEVRNDWGVFFEDDSFTSEKNCRLATKLDNVLK